ncbi:MAG TPA: thioredoxin [Paludibacteraceae bacterium]|nr:thioredoxin [Paludibacteraceae bacterium]HQF50078.1 thioredoxin [Paludibacteraceae bacterium]HQJ91103.1 thioredoxin [Paludibacteraceae bacterium]
MKRNRNRIKQLSIIALMSVAMVSCTPKGKKIKVINEETSINQINNKSMSAIEMNKAMFLEKVANYETNPSEFKYLGDKPAIIDFYATWCGPCKAMSPVIDEMAEKYGDKLVVYKIDVDKEGELAGLFHVQSIPTLLFIPMNGQPQISVGAISKANLQDAVTSVLGLK